MAMTATADPSTRYVLPADAPYLKNLAELWATDPLLAEAVELVPEDAVYRTEDSRAGPPTLCIEGDDGGRRYLHSRHQPVEEARRLVDGVQVEGKLLFCVLGLGLGYHLEELFARAGGEAIIVVFEPDMRLIRTVLQCRDLSALIASRRVLFLTRLDKSLAFPRLSPHGALLSVGMATLAHPPSLLLHKEFFRGAQTLMGEFVSYARTNLNTLVINGRRTCQNIASNLGWYLRAPGIGRLENRHKGEPAIIVSAGPSLRKNKHLLKDAQGRAVLIAVQTTLQVLLDMGVEPQYVTSLDYHDICTRFYERLPRHLRTELVAEPKASSAIFELYPGPMSILGNDFADKLLGEMKLDRPRLRAGATVAHLAYYLAEYMGCDPIIFVGQDLGFADGLCYAPGTSYEDVWRPELGRFCTMEMKQWEQIVRERPILRRILDVNGLPMYTEERLYTYLQQFERDFGMSRARIIDATEGGARKRGTVAFPLAQTLQQFCTRPVRQPRADHPGLSGDGLADAVRSLEMRIAEAAQIGQIATQTLALLQEMRDHAADTARVNRCIARIDALRARMDRLSGCYELITQMTQTTEMLRFQRDCRIASSKLDAAERQRQQIERDIDNVQGIIAAAEQFTAMLRQVVGGLCGNGSARELAA